MLLLQGGEPVSLGDLHTDLTEKWSSAIRPITISVDGLGRVLNSDVFYGFVAIPVDEPEPEELVDSPLMLTASSDEDAQLSRIMEVLAADDEEDEDLFGEDDLDEDDDDLYEEDDDEETE